MSSSATPRGPEARRPWMRSKTAVSMSTRSAPSAPGTGATKPCASMQSWSTNRIGVVESVRRPPAFSKKSATSARSARKFARRRAFGVTEAKRKKKKMLSKHPPAPQKTTRLFPRCYAEPSFACRPLPAC
eukprot:1194791-Prorocentrum_minimum.AAC.2